MKSRGFPPPCINRFLSLLRYAGCTGPAKLVGDVGDQEGPGNGEARRGRITPAARTSDVTAPITCAGYFRGVDTSEITPATGNLSRILLETFRLCVLRAIRPRLRPVLPHVPYSFDSRLRWIWERLVHTKRVGSEIIPIEVRHVERMVLLKIQKFS